MSALLSAVGSAQTTRSSGLAHSVVELGSTDQTWPDLLTIHYCRAGLRRQERQGGWVTGGEGKLGFRHFGRLAFRKHHASLGKQTLCQLSYSRLASKRSYSRSRERGERGLGSGPWVPRTFCAGGKGTRSIGLVLVLAERRDGATRLNPWRQLVGDATACRQRPAGRVHWPGARPGCRS